MKQFETSNKTRLCVQYDDHPKLMCTVLCSLMEHQSLVDLAIRCGNNTMHAHKCILAASSPYFREQLELNPGAEQVILNGIDFSTMKSVIEFIYCGETSVLEENLKYVVAAARLFQIRGLQALSSEVPGNPEELYIPPPIFMNKKPKYSNALVPEENAPELLVDETRSGGTSQNQGVTAYHHHHHCIPEGTTYISQLDTLPLQMVIESKSIIPLNFNGGGGTDNHEVLGAIPPDAIRFEVVGSNVNETGMPENDAVNRQQQQLPLPTGEKCQNYQGTVAGSSPGGSDVDLDSIIYTLEKSQKRPRLDEDVVQEVFASVTITAAPAASVTVNEPNRSPAREHDDILNEMNKRFYANGMYENVVMPKIVPVYTTTHPEQDDSQAILENDMLMHSRIGIDKRHHVDETGYQPEDMNDDDDDDDDSVDFLLQMPN